MSKTKATLLGVGTTYATHAGTSAIQSIASPRYGSGGSYAIDYLPPVLVAGAGAFYLSKKDNLTAYSLIGAALGDVALRTLASKLRFSENGFAKGIQAISNSVAYGVNDTSLGYCAMFPFEVNTLTQETIEQIFKICIQNSPQDAARILVSPILNGQLDFRWVWVGPDNGLGNAVIEISKMEANQVSVKSFTESDLLELIANLEVEGNNESVKAKIKALSSIGALCAFIESFNSALDQGNLLKSGSVSNGFQIEVVNSIKKEDSVPKLLSFKTLRDNLSVELGIARLGVILDALKQKQEEIKARRLAETQSKPTASAKGSTGVSVDDVKQVATQTLRPVLSPIVSLQGMKSKRKLGKIIAEPKANISLRSSDEDFKPNLPAVSEKETRGALLNAIDGARPLTQSELIAEGCGAMGVDVIIVRVSPAVCEQAVSLGVVVDLGPSKLQQGLRLVAVEGGAGVYTPSQAKEYGVAEGLLDTSAIESASTIDVVSDGILTRSTFRPLYR